MKSNLASAEGIHVRIEEAEITKSILHSYMRELSRNLQLDVAIGGAGPSGMVAAYYLARSGFRTAIFERKLSVGGGMWGGGMMFNRIVIQEEGKVVLDEFGVKAEVAEEGSKGLYVADSVEATSALCLGALRAGARIFNLITIEDVAIRGGAMVGLVMNWSAVDMAKLHVDPMVVMARKTIDATGHDSELCRMVERKMGPKLRTPTGRVMGEGPMWAEKGEKALVRNSREVYPNLFVAGMAANAVLGGPRMGPIFGGMLLSGKACAQRVAAALKHGR
jgi:thiamine thiazole synthase